MRRRHLAAKQIVCMREDRSIGRQHGDWLWDRMKGFTVVDAAVICGKPIQPIASSAFGD